MKRPNLYVAASVVFWVLAGVVFWAFLETLAFGCQLRERDSGLAAECFAPAGLFFGLAFLTLLAVDALRAIFAFRMRRETPRENVPGETE